jgi:hypothetical protein
VVTTGRLPLVTPETRAAVRVDLTRWKACVVVLGPQAAQPKLKILLEQLLGPAEHDHDVWLWDVRE